MSSSSDSGRTPNRLAKESSPYLLQHAYNPVDWYPWGEEALNRAKQEDKPILVSIGYAACHWCHVMERESFENEEVAAMMNERFVCIKVDREERPDVDHIYMDAVQAITGQGGWPLNMFLTPEGKPFYGGTYFPPQNNYGRPSWTQVLTSVEHAFKTNREGVEDQAEKLTQYLANSDSNLVSIIIPEEGKKEFSEVDQAKIFEELSKRFDKINGGFGMAPKFPNTLNIQFLMQHYYHDGNQQALDHALLSLDKMIMGGIYDQLGGGFSRYSVDERWLVPHFEKMLYDNALLVAAMSEAYQITRNPLYKDTVQQTLEFLTREMTSPEGGFYAALDADSEGHEGKFYVWSKAEIDKALGEDAKVFNEFYDVSEEGNWEESNILNVPISYADFSVKHKIPEDELRQTLESSRQKLVNIRNGRIRPGLDDKIILSWNALMCSGLVKAYEAFGNPVYLGTAEQNMAFILEKFLEVREEGAYLFHTYKDGVARYPGFIDDYAALAEAMLDLYQVNYDERLIQIATEIVNTAIHHFYDDNNGQFYFTPDFQTDIIVRKKELFDGVTPSGNATMASALLRLGLMLGNDEYTRIAYRMVLSIKASAINYSTSFCKWAMVMLQYIHPVKEIAIVGEDWRRMSRLINRHYIPGKIQMASSGEVDTTYPLLEGKTANGKTQIYLCVNYTCGLPYDNFERFEQDSGIFLRSE